VLASTGYMLWLPAQYLEEPTSMVGGNQLIVEHRYFAPSRPAPADWSMLTIQQAAADHHRVVQAFAPIYSGKWISTGVSKGGMTSVYHHRFYPGDVSGTIAYVAPHSSSLDDPRYIDFMAKVGDATCRTKLRDFEREVLLRRPFIAQKMKDQALAGSFTYDIFGVDATLESTTSWLSWSFWQYWGTDRCPDVPTAAATDEQVWAFFDEIGAPSANSDASMIGFEPYYWQGFLQLGTPGADLSHLQDLLTINQSVFDSLPTIGANPKFDPTAMQDVGDWLKTKGSHFLFIYGGNDPWAAGAFELGNAQDSFRFFAAGKNHGAAIADLVPAERATAEGAVEAWTGVKPGQSSKVSSKAREIDMRMRRRLRPR
jgi:hypothetical protein